MGLRPVVVFDCVETWTSNSGTELFDVLPGDSFPLDSCSFKWQWPDWDRIHSDFWSVYCPSDVLTASLSHLLCGSNRLISRALNSPSAFSMKHCALLFRIPSQIQHLWRCALLTLSHQVGTNSCNGSLPCSLSNGFFSSRPFCHLDKMHPACSTNHGRLGDSSRSGSCVQLSM